MIRLPIAVGVVASLLALTASPAQATFPGTNGMIAYTSGNRVWVINDDGSGAQAVSPDGLAISGGPTWSADGQWIAFTAYTQPPAGRSGIYLVHPDGSGLTVVRTSQYTWTSGLAYQGPGLSPDGRFVVVFTYDFSTGQGAIQRMGLAGGPVRTLVPFGVGQEASPTYSPDGSRILYQLGSEIWVMRANGAHQHAVVSTGDAWRPDWSPDGARIIFTRDVICHTDRHRVETFVVLANGRHMHRLSGCADHEYGASWSADGTRIAVVKGGTRTVPPALWTFPLADPAMLTEVPGTTYSDFPSWQPLPA